MLRAVLGAAVLAAAVATTATPATAIRECDLGEVSCYRTCYLPHYDKPSGQIYWYAC